MKHRATRRRSFPSRLRPPARLRRPSLLIGLSVAGALTANLLVAGDPAAQAGTPSAGAVSVARALGLTARSTSAGPGADLAPLQHLAASRSSRDAQRTAAQQAQASADQAALDRQKAEQEAAAQAAAQGAAGAAAPQPAAAPGAGTKIAHIVNTAGPVRPQTQAAADAVVTNVPGADAIKLGGTRPSATDPGGHPSGLAVDYMVLSNVALGNAIVAYTIAHWAQLGVAYIIYRQRILMSPDGAWQAMADRGSPTANHMDHVHVNYR